MRFVLATELRAGRCKSCKEPIYWIKTVKGNWMPVNRRAIMATPVQKGGHTFVMIDGTTVQALPEGMVRYDGVDSVIAFEAHFATCPDADTFRKKRR
jgi:hypothetical protein